jgi:large subunit ribosomal protein L9
MKLILTQEVSRLGSVGDVVEVKDGYGRNYLVPQGFAMRWTRGGEKQVSSIRRAREVREIRDASHAREVKGQLEALTVTLTTRAGESGRLFGSVTVADVMTAVKAAGGPDIDKRRVQIPGPIKTVGSHRVEVNLHPEVSASIQLQVVASVA